MTLRDAPSGDGSPFDAFVNAWRRGDRPGAVEAWAGCEAAIERAGHEVELYEGNDFPQIDVSCAECRWRVRADRDSAFIERGPEIEEYVDFDLVIECGAWTILFARGSDESECGWYSLLRADRRGPDATEEGKG